MYDKEDFKEMEKVDLNYFIPSIYDITDDLLSKHHVKDLIYCSEHIKQKRSHSRIRFFAYVNQETPLYEDLVHLKYDRG